MVIRKYVQSDCKEIIKLFFNAIHAVNLKDYSKEQVQAWAGKSVSNVDYILWNKELSSSHTLIAEQNNMIVRFGNIMNSGYLDKLFVHKNFQGLDIAYALLRELEKYTYSHNIAVIENNVSITAKPFFEKNGFCVISKQKQKRHEVVLVNYKMKKIIKSH